MPKITRDTELEDEWAQALIDKYESEERREGVHVSDLLLCLRQTVIQDKYEPEWSPETLYRFTFGRAFETALAEMLLGMTIQEAKVEDEGIVGSIDFAGDDVDYESKATQAWPTDDTEEFFEKRFYWLEQAGTYAIMRRRTESVFAVLHLTNPPTMPRAYRIEWSKKELGDLWSMMKTRRDYIAEHRANGTYPKKTPLTWLCTGCPVRRVCYEVLKED